MACCVDRVLLLGRLCQRTRAHFKGTQLLALMPLLQLTVSCLCNYRLPVYVQVRMYLKMMRQRKEELDAWAYGMDAYTARHMKKALRAGTSIQECFLSIAAVRLN